MIYAKEQADKRNDMLNPHATKHPDESESDPRLRFQHDRDRIVWSTAFKRLAHKTQVFPQQYSDHHRRRLTHSLEVMQLATSIARTLGLNEILCEAIALGHDLGHTPS
jgi:dGTPase